MAPYYQDDWLTVYHGDCRDAMQAMEPESVHCVVTSPPYWGLRDYGTATWIGGDDGCDHRPLAAGRATRPAGGLEGGKATVDAGTVRGGDCGRCGAVRQDAQLGLEASPEEYVANMVAVFREVRRVLRADGTVWLNLGDSYAGGPSGPQGVNGQRASRTFTASTIAKSVGLAQKQLVGIPWRVAFALQADGWYLRSDIIWSKPNPMPESVTDRPTKSHEYLFLLSKSPRYYFDAEAVAEASIRAGDIPMGGGGYKGDGVNDGRTRAGLAAAVLRPVAPTRNIRSVWTIATAPYPGAHFATFPPKLVEPCIKAGTSERGVCPECGAPWEREVEREQFGKAFSATKYDHTAQAGPLSRSRQAYRAAGLEGPPSPVTTGWRPSCAHISPLPPRPATILDPFAGSGTTGMVAQSLSRRAVLIDLSLDYLGQLMRRNADVPLGLGA